VPGHWCLIDDSLTPLLNMIAACDCLIFGSPLYFDSVSAQAKLVIDRCNCFRPADFANTDPQHDFLKRIPRTRPGAMLFVGGEQGFFEGARKVVAGWFRWIEVTTEGVLIFHSRDYHHSGEAALNDNIMQQARDLGRTLARHIEKHHERP
jgi:multimeric flavodoxin WrbA